MVTIYKYRLSPTSNVIEMPEGAQVLSVHEQQGDVCLYAEVDTSRPYENRLFLVAGTGWNIDDSDMHYGRKFIGTVVCDGLWGQLVWHVFELIRRIGSPPIQS